MRFAPRLWLWVAAAAAVVAAVVAVAWLAQRARGPEAPPPEPSAAEAAPPPAPPAVAGAAESPGAAPGAELDPLGGTWEHVDMEAIRRAMPDNLYWKMAVPSDDPRIQEERAAERARWNVEYGKVLSGTATEQEIEAYFDHRHRLSRDYVEFTKYVLEHYGSELPEQDVGLLMLAQRLHLARLAELPRKLIEAQERKTAQDAAREAWLAEQAEFAGDEAEAEGD